MILGIDEVGRGPWAGPLVVGAVILGDAVIDGLNDSKKLTAKKRQKLDVEIREKAAAWALGWVSARELDEIGISRALRLATRRSVKQIQKQTREKNLAFDEIIIDGKVNFLADTKLEKYVTTLAKADGLIPSVSAASIIAKVARDRYMAEQDVRYPGYGFSLHVGYGTAKHRAAIEKLGVTPLHRLSFAPLRKYTASDYRTKRVLQEDDHTAVELRQTDRLHDSMTKQYEERSTTRSIGDIGENVVADYLRKNNHHIVARNWRTRYCEIDVVSHCNGTLYFTEVKYRKNANFGDGLAAITARKQKQIRFAAKLFVAQHREYRDSSIRLLAADVRGAPAEVIQVVPVE